MWDMTIGVDAGALIGLDRDERPRWVRLKAARSRGDVRVTHAGILGQTWREGPRQARLPQASTARALGEDLAQALRASSWALPGNPA